MRFDRVALVLAPLAAISCAKVSVVGISGEPDDSQVPNVEIGKPAHDPAKYTSTIAAPPGMMMGFNQPILGDVDGDGLDDFLVLGSYLPQSGPTPDAMGPGLITKAFLFYGKSQLAQKLSTADADAVFDAEEVGVSALGDVNGDGLADFAIGHVHGYELVFGRPTRYAGAIAAHTVGVTWAAAPLPSPVSPDVAPLHAVRGAGDIDGDGIDDLIVTPTSFEPQAQLESSSFGLIETDYLVLGHRGEWADGTWDPSMAVAMFGIEDAVDADGSHHRRTLGTSAGGDLDGDGVADLLAQGGSSVYVFYGGAGKWSGTLDATVADVRFDDVVKPKSMVEIDREPDTLFAIGDLDGDGASDLALAVGDALGVIYGAHTRWSGAMQLPRDYVIDFSSDARLRLIAAAQSGDIDGDGAPELAVMTQSISPNDPTGGSWFDDTLYIFRGAHQRAVGTHLVTAGDIHPLASDVSDALSLNALFSASARTDTLLSMAGDVDGDGSCDIVTGHPGGLNGDITTAEVYVIPSTPNDPD